MLKGKRTVWTPTGQPCRVNMKRVMYRLADDVYSTCRFYEIGDDASVYRFDRQSVIDRKVASRVF